MGIFDLQYSWLRAYELSTGSSRSTIRQSPRGIINRINIPSRNKVIKMSCYNAKNKPHSTYRNHNGWIRLIGDLLFRDEYQHAKKSDKYNTYQKQNRIRQQKRFFVCIANKVPKKSYRHHDRSQNNIYVFYFFQSFLQYFPAYERKWSKWWLLTSKTYRAFIHNLFTRQTIL